MPHDTLPTMVPHAGETDRQVWSICDREKTISLDDGSTIVVEPGWRYAHDGGVNMIASPEQVLRLVLIVMPEGPRDTDDIEQAWQRVDPTFALKPRQTTRPATKKGWDGWCNVDYDTPPAERRIVWANRRAFRGQSYIALLDSPTDVCGRRNAQLTSILQSWQPSGFHRPTLDGRAVRSFSSDQFESFVKFAMAELEVPGTSIAVLHRGEVVLSAAYGVKEVGRLAEIDRGTRFMIGSITKPLTTLMMGRLVDQKKLAWDERIADALPGFTLGDPHLTARLSVRLSVSASTGMPRRDAEFLFRGRHLSAEELMQTMKSMKPTTGLGETFQYSNLLVAAGGFAAARRYRPEAHLESAYARAMSELVFNPVGMNASSIAGADPQPENRAVPHGRDINGELVPTGLDPTAFVRSNTPAGGAWSTAEDLARYVRLELNKGVDADGTRVIAEEPLLARRAPGIKVNRETHYGLGLLIGTHRGITVVEHGGNIMGFTSDMLFIPETGTGLILLNNAADAYAFQGAVRAKLFEMLFEDDAVAEKIVDTVKAQRAEAFARLRRKVSTDTKDTSWMGDWLGRYQNPDLGVLEVSRSDNRYWVATESWTRQVGSSMQVNGDKTVVVVEPPLRGFEFIPCRLDEEQALVFDDSEVKYEFMRV